MHGTSTCLIHIYGVMGRETVEKTDFAVSFCYGKYDCSPTAIYLHRNSRPVFFVIPSLFALFLLVLFAAGGRAVFRVGLACNKRALALVADFEGILLIRQRHGKQKLNI